MHSTVLCKLLHTYQKIMMNIKRPTEVQLFYSRSYHRLHTVFQRWSENERFESQFIRRGTIGLDCSARLTHLQLCTLGPVLWASTETSHFRAMIRGSALGKILLLCGWISVQWAGCGSNTAGWQSTDYSPHSNPLHEHTHTNSIAMSVYVQFLCMCKDVTLSGGN